VSGVSAVFDVWCLVSGVSTVFGVWWCFTPYETPILVVLSDAKFGSVVL
jgi:hypothetical protein